MTVSSGTGNGDPEESRTPTVPDQHRSATSSESSRPLSGWTRSLAEKRLGFAWVITFATGALFITRGDPAEPGRVAAPVVLLFLYALYGATYKRKNTPKFAD